MAGRDHVVTVEKLRGLLAGLPVDYSVQPNRVNNLTLFDAGMTYVGYVDMMDEEVVLFADEDEEDEETEAKG